MTKTSNKNRRKPSRDKFAVFDFPDGDDPTEKRYNKFWKPSSKHQKPKKCSSPVDKYTFLACFAGGTKSVENDSVHEVFIVDDRDEIAEKKMLESGSSNLKISKEYCLDYLESDCDTSGPESCSTRVIHGHSISEDKCFSGRHPLILADNEPVILDSDDDTQIELSKPDCYLQENEGDQTKLMQSHNLCDTESSVVVNPDHIIWGDKCITSSILTFSCSSIKLEGSSSLGTELSFTYEWKLCAILSINSFWCDSVKTASVDLHLKSKDAEVAKTDNENSDAVVLKCSLFDPDWFRTQEAIKRLDLRYKDIWNDTTMLDSTRSYNQFLWQNSIAAPKHYCPNSTDNFEEVIYPEGDPDAVSISKRDVDLLQPKTFINDTIIDFYIMYLKNKVNQEEKDRFHFFNSFFFRKLADLDKDPSSACEGRAAFQRVRRWTAKVDLFGKDFIFIPVNFSLHWSLIIICHPGEVAAVSEEEMEKSRVPCILHMDSIRGSHKGLKNLIKSYLLEEWKDRHTEVSEDVARKFSNLSFVPLKLPQQENLFDCGLFLLHYVELFLEQAPVNFNPSMKTASSKFLAEDWFSTEDVASKRECIKRLIFEITINKVQKVSPADFNENNTLLCLEEENTCMDFIQETCNARENQCHRNDLSSHSDEHTTVSPVANLIRGMKSAAVSEVVCRDIGDSAKPLTVDNYRHYGPKAQLNLFSKLMSPIEEDAVGEQMSISPAIKEGSQPIAAPHVCRSDTLFLGRLSLSPHSEKITTGCGSNGGGSSNSEERDDEEDLRAEVEEVSGPDAAKYDTPISTKELAAWIVLDSQEEDENHNENGLANNLPTTSALCHKEVDSTDMYCYKVNEKLLSSLSVEQAVKKPRHVPEVLELSSCEKGEEQIVSCSTSSEGISSCFILDSEEVDSNICVEANNLKPAKRSEDKQIRHLFRHPQRARPVRRSTTFELHAL